MIPVDKIEGFLRDVTADIESHFAPKTSTEQKLPDSSVKVKDGLQEAQKPAEIKQDIEDTIPPIDISKGTWWKCKSLKRLREIDSNPKRNGIGGTRKLLKDLKVYLKKHKREDVAATLTLKDDLIITTIPYEKMFLQK